MKPFSGACRRHALELGAARAEQTAAWLRTHTFMPPAERAEWSEFVRRPPCCFYVSLQSYFFEFQYM